MADDHTENAPVPPTESPLRAWRLAADLTLDEACRAADVTRTTWENWEKGRSSPRAEHIARLVKLKPGLLEALGIGGTP